MNFSIDYRLIILGLHNIENWDLSYLNICLLYFAIVGIQVFYINDELRMLLMLVLSANIRKILMHWIPSLIAQRFAGCRIYIDKASILSFCSIRLYEALTELLLGFSNVRTRLLVLLTYSNFSRMYTICSFIDRRSLAAISEMMPKSSSGILNGYCFII